MRQVLMKGLVSDACRLNWGATPSHPSSPPTEMGGKEQQAKQVGRTPQQLPRDVSASAPSGAASHGNLLRQRGITQQVGIKGGGGGFKQQAKQAICRQPLHGLRVQCIAETCYVAEVAVRQLTEPFVRQAIRRKEIMKKLR